MRLLSADTRLRLRLLARPSAIVGGVMAVAGTMGVAASYLPWYEVTATIDVLGVSQDRVVASLAGWEAHAWGWVAPALALLAFAAGVAHILDRALPTGASMASGVGMALSVAAAGLVFPPVGRFDVAGSTLRELTAVSDRVPSDIALQFSVHPAVGLWLTLAASALVVGAALAIHDPA